ncbi:PepSY domain-containing protein [Paenibacillus sp. 481]|uniref:PepSY domain-containing protein n=1 Tax=Paenibacillus sp. 481 TaxID=2835869 RepID=UPI001E6273A4|nr:PepSY domain-containing protein [Paenibacillus sp. 481]UHA72204.1 PepSY domain-containing protein [Paenibacillus sp. 481]
MMQMKRNRIFALVGAAVILIAILLGVKFIFAKEDHALFSKEQMRKHIMEKYPGEITDLSLEPSGRNFVYTMKLHNENGTYDIKADASTGDVLHLALVNKKVNGKPTTPTQPTTPNNPDGSTVTPKPVTPTTPDKPKQPPGTKSITEQQAKQIALQKAQGKVTQLKQGKRNGVDVYVVTVDSAKSKSIVEVNKRTGGVEFSSTQKKKQQPAKPTEGTSGTGGTGGTGATKKPQSIISQAEAKKIATTKVKGTVIKIEYEEDDAQYEVEIQTSNNETVTVEVNAYTGKTSVSWDD